MTKKDTNICKAIAVIMMLMHHLFYNVGDLDQYNIIYGGLIPNRETANILGYLGKMCVSIFVFLTGYGTAKSYMERDVQVEDTRVSVRYTAKRYWKLLTSFWFVFLFAVLISPLMSKLSTAIAGTSLKEIFGSFPVVSSLYLLTDFMGLSNILQSPTFNATWWYMSYALMLVVIMPFVFLTCKKWGLWALVIEFFLIRYLNVHFDLFWYMLTLFMGVLAAQTYFYERLNEMFNSGSVSRKISLIVLGGGTLTLCVYLRWQVGNVQFWDVFEAVNALALGVFVMLTVGRVPVLSHILDWVGKHSMNVFLTHTLLYYHWFRGHIYSMRYPLLILFVLLAESLILSVVLETLKKLLRWNQLTEWLWRKLDNHFGTT